MLTLLIMYIVCGYRYDCVSTQGARVLQFGFYKTYEDAWIRLTNLMGTQTPKPTGFSQSYTNQFGVLWIHRLEFGDYEMNLNQPLSLSANT